MVGGFRKLISSRMFIQRIVCLNLFDELSLRQSLIFMSNLTITAGCMRRVFRVYKGNVFRNFTIDRFLVGRRFSEFNFVRKPFTYVQKKKQPKQNLLRR